MTLYEVIKKYANEEGICVLRMLHASITFSYGDVRRWEFGKRETDIGSFTTFSISDVVKFSFYKKTDDWIHFNDCNNLGYQLSIKKAAR
ncbi:hypothetical protein [Turicibacter sanguinis]|uniref:hypothetical protein n=1 Tax=Turicibacter sanguinis TaxID=154288 RepID=UPI0018A97E38|nr:hypothetical protein [Turicibacter sanguinis]MDB8552145.1 hypothetical protein [Turicibacter sanguinis]